MMLCKIGQKKLKINVSCEDFVVLQKGDQVSLLMEFEVIDRVHDNVTLQLATKTALVDKWQIQPRGEGDGSD